jgi:hypothetical protein
MSLANSLPDNVIDYLKKFSSSIWKLEKEDDRLFENIVVIPSLAEYERISNCLSSLEKNDFSILQKALVIVVLNNSENADKELVQNNLATREILDSYKGNLNINYVDAFSSGKAIPKKLAGVGFARKIGLDLAITKFDYDSQSKKILFWLDADCEVAENYFSSITNKFNKDNLTSAVIEYEHKIDDEKPESKAIVCYETFLRYFKLALTYAKSHYNYHAIGSTIVCDVVSYIKAGGMNSKQAGEDFYFLEKLAKQNKVVTIKEPLVYPSSRKSWRVPFGTGQRITRFLKNIQNEYLVYNPMCFELLRDWLSMFNSDSSINSDKIIGEAKSINIHLYNFLAEHKFEESWNKILKNSDSTNEIRKQKIYWFDAFRTLKLIHYLQDNLYPNINIYDAFYYFWKKFNLEFQFDLRGIKNNYETQKQFLISLRNFFRDKL